MNQKIQNKKIYNIDLNLKHLSAEEQKGKIDELIDNLKNRFEKIDSSRYNALTGSSINEDVFFPKRDIPNK